MKIKGLHCLLSLFACKEAGRRVSELSFFLDHSDVDVSQTVYPAHTPEGLIQSTIQHVIGQRRLQDGHLRPAYTYQAKSLEPIIRHLQNSDSRYLEIPHGNGNCLFASPAWITRDGQYGKEKIIPFIEIDANGNIHPAVFAGVQGENLASGRTFWDELTEEAHLKPGDLVSRYRQLHVQLP